MILLLVLGLLLLGCAQQGGTAGTTDATTGTQGGTGGTQNGAGTPGTTLSGGGVEVSTVRISGFAFQPAELSVKQGDSVTWVNDDSAPHTIKMEGVFESSTLAKGQSYTHKFTEAPGDYPYSCAIHPSMHGKITVTK